MSSSIFGLRKFVATCENYADKNDISNEKKSACLRFSNKKLTFHPGSVVLNGAALEWQLSVKYLGVNIMWNLSDQHEIASQMRNFYAKASSVVVSTSFVLLQLNFVILKSSV